MERDLLNKKVYAKLPKDLQLVTEPFELREKDIVLLSSIGVLSCCLPNIKGIYSGNNIFPNLYTLFIAPPASGKGSMNFSRDLVQKIHTHIMTSSKKEMALCEKEKKKSNSSKSDPCPTMKIKILPANTSSAELYSYIGSAPHGVLIMESEADTLSNMLNNDWSNYSDVLRKAFHHEPISISRKMEKIFEEISEPKLSLVISGTPNQLQPLIKSKDNGLFSRFLIYNFDEISDFKDVFEPKSRDNRKPFTDLSDGYLQLYNKLEKFTNPVEFQFTASQNKKFIKLFRTLQSKIVEDHTSDFLANLYRHGLNMFRIAMILTTIRLKDDIKDGDIMICSNRDFVNALRIVLTLLEHAQFTFDTIESGIVSIQDEQILDQLKTSFTRKQILEVGVKMNIPQRTIDDKLAQYQKKKVIKRLSKGNYKQI